MQQRQFSWRARLRSFIYAFEGVAWFFKNEHNAWIHAVATVVALLASFFFKISGRDFIAILVAIALVLMAEMFNTAIEKMMDHLSPDIHPTVKIVKDISAVAVVIAAIVAVIIGSFIFIPKIL